MNTDLEKRSQMVKKMAIEHGFMGAGIARAAFMEEEAVRLEEWLARGYHGEMAYMANHFDIRLDPTKLVPGAKSVISLLYNYATEDPGTGNDIVGSNGHGNYKDAAKNKETSLGNFKISRYAYGEDYHKVVRRKLKALVQDLKKEIGDFHARVFVDSAPVMERDWAKRSGAGWIGKNTLLINPKKGSYFFLAEIILDVEFEYDHPIRDHCGTCTRCIDACPTDAISPEGYILDGSKCISYLTIELRSQIPEEFTGKVNDWIFGCDICQEVCPWNRFSSPHEEPAFTMSDELKSMSSGTWEELTDEVFQKLFEKSPVKRTGYEGLVRNIRFATRKGS